MGEKAGSSNGMSSNGHQDPSPRGHRRWKKRLVLGFFALLLVGLIIDGVYVALTLRNSLLAAESSLRSGEAALREADPQDAERSFESAADQAGTAATAIDHPSPLLARAIPPFRLDIEATKALAQAVVLAAEAGREASAGLEAMGVSDEGIAATLYADGQVRFDTVEAGAPFFKRAHSLISRASATIDQSPAPRSGILEQAVEEAAQQLEAAEHTTARGAILLDALPSLLGDEGPRRYLLAFQSPSEARGTGGVIGLYGVLEASEGHLRLGRIGPYQELMPIERVSAPAWFERRYADFASLRQWPQANLSPHVEAVSDVLLEMYENARGEALDGVMMMDPLALGQLTRGTGPLQGHRLDLEVDPDNAADVLLRRSYVDIQDPEEQNRFLRSIVKDFWAKLNGDDLNVPELASGLAEAVRTRHLILYSTEPRDAEALRTLEADGGFTRYGPNLQFVWHNNVAANKVDYFLKRHIQISIALHSDGSADVRTNIEIENQAPAGPASLLLGPGIRGDEPGLNRMYLNVALSPEKRSTRFEVDGSSTFPLRGWEDEHPVVWDVLELAPHSSVHIELSYTIANAFDPSERDHSFQFSLIPQPRVVPDTYSIAIAGVPQARTGLIEETGVLDEVKTFTYEID